MELSGFVGRDNKSLVSFFNQMILDFSFPMDEVLSHKCLEAIENVLAWALFTQGTESFVGISSINSTVQQGLQFVPLTTGTFSSITSSLRVFFTNVKANAQMTPQDFKDSLTVVINNLVAHLREPNASARELVVTVISCRDGDLIGEWLDSLHDDLTHHVDTFQVVELCRTRIAQPSISLCGPTREGRPIVRLAVVPAARTGTGAGVAAAGVALEAVLRSAWYTPRWSELLPLELELGAGRTGVTLKCVASQCVLDPVRLPCSDHFTLLASGGGTVGGGTVRDVQVLRGISRVAADGVCEGSLFGLPLRAMWAPPATFQWHAEAYQRNAHMFLALCESLSDKDEYLVVKVQTSGHAGGAGGHFILMPGDECVLLRAAASAELLLPTPPPPPLHYDGAEAARAEAEVLGALDTLPVEEQYRANHSPSGLCAALKLSTRFPQRLSLSRQSSLVGKGDANGRSGTETRFQPQQQPQQQPAASPQPLQQCEQQCAATEHQEDDVVEVLLSDDDLPEVNVRGLGMAVPRSATGSAAGSAGGGSSGGSAAALGATHKLGTGGHPALQDDFVPPAKRKKAQPLHGIFKSRRHY